MLGWLNRLLQPQLSMKIEQLIVQGRHPLNMDINFFGHFLSIGRKQITFVLLDSSSRVLISTLSLLFMDQLSRGLFRLQHGRNMPLLRVQAVVVVGVVAVVAVVAVVVVVAWDTAWCVCVCALHTSCTEPELLEKHAKDLKAWACACPSWFSTDSHPLMCRLCTIGMLIHIPPLGINMLPFLRTWNSQSIRYTNARLRT